MYSGFVFLQCLDFPLCTKYLGRMFWQENSGEKYETEVNIAGQNKTTSFTV